ncbi:MAG TPA: transcriptional regulator CynR [Ramlibacter sp.]|nr:transcriptional regulator CynR [Ramlibacter sp.]
MTSAPTPGSAAASGDVFRMRLRPGIKYRQLQYFLAVAQSLHFSKAAEKLFVTQPTLSHQLAELEAQLGIPLFDRLGKSVRLTQAGETFRAYAQRSIDEIEAGCNALAELEGLQRGQLSIGVTQSFVHRLMPPIITEFLARYPAVHLDVQEMTASQIERHLADGVLDLGIAFAPSALEDTELEPILEERLLLVARRDHPLASQPSVRMAELAGVPLVLLRRDYSTRQLIEDYLAQAGVRPNVACETNTIDLMRGLAATSGLAAILPESSVGKLPELCVLPLVDPVPMRTSALLWSRHKFRTLAAKTFAQIVRDRFVSGMSGI